MGELGDAQAVLLLIKALTDVQEVRWAATDALHKIRVVTIASLQLTLQNADSEVRRIAAEMIEAIGDELSKEPLTLTLTDPDPDVRKAVDAALANLPKRSLESGE